MTFKLSSLFSKKSKNVDANTGIASEHTVSTGIEGTPVVADNESEQFSVDIILPNPTGLHARPAATIVKMAKSFAAKSQMIHKDNTANLKSVVDILNLETHKDAKVTLIVSGEDAKAAFEALSVLISSGSGEDCSEIAPTVATDAEKQTTAKSIIKVGLSGEDLAGLDKNQCFKGVSVSDGLAFGEVFVLTQAEITFERLGSGVYTERTSLKNAITQAKTNLTNLVANAKSDTQKNILEAHISLLDDPSLFDGASDLLVNNVSAAFAWKQLIDAQKTKLLTSTSDVLAERANDLEDIGNRVLRILTGQPEQSLELPAHCILLANNLTPSDTINLDREKVMAFATVEGGATSHVAILARAMNLPALCAMPSTALAIKNGTSALIDTKSSQLIIQPSDALIAKVDTLIAQLKNLDNEARANAMAPAIMKDGIKIEVVGNVTSVEETTVAIKNGAEGVGLLRTEILFVDSKSEPTEETQTAVYSAIAKECGLERPLVLRTLDIGGDKPVPYINVGKEDNPFLGVRGLRLCLSMPEMFRRQIRSVLRAAVYTKMHIMFPMVTNLSELLTAREMVREEKKALGITEYVPVGIMIEVPAAALLAEHFAPHVDFFSIGTNDLTQYTLAMDRGHAALAKEADAFHPAVLQLIAKTCDAANKHGKWVGVCGGLASDSMATGLLIGLGVKELSASGNSIAHVKATVRTLTMAHCQALAERALAADSPQAVREIINQSA